MHVSNSFGDVLSLVARLLPVMHATFGRRESSAYMLMQVLMATAQDALPKKAGTSSCGVVRGILQSPIGLQQFKVTGPQPVNDVQHIVYFAVSRSEKFTGRAVQNGARTTDSSARTLRTYITFYGPISRHQCRQQ